MFIDIGFAPIITLLVAAVTLAIIADFLLELVSVRLTLSSGRFQHALFDRMGSTLFQDLLISSLFQLISFRKRAFFMQLACFVNVGSFNKRQSLFIVYGAFIGMGLSAALLLLIHPILGIAFGVLGFLMTLLTKDQFKDVGVSALNFGLFILAVYFFNQFLMSSPLTIHQFKFGAPFIGLIIFVSAVFFRTPVAFILTLSMFHFLVGLNIWLLPLAFFLYSLFFLGKYYFYFFKGFKRLSHLLLTTMTLQWIQLFVAYSLIYLWGSHLESFMANSSFIGAYSVIVVAFIVYFTLTMILSLPILFAFQSLPFFNESEKKSPSSQKILNLPQRGNLFSLHFSMFLLRQEFGKYSTLVHTIFKLSREADVEEESVNERLTRYQRILIRVGDEIKELCFSIGKQRSYRWHVQEIMTFYKYVNQLELLVDDLSQIFLLLQEKDIDEEWEKECRFWLSVQMRIFESFYNYTLGVGKDEPDKVKANIQKSYDVLERLFDQEVSHKKIKSLSKNFYRVTESNANLAI